MNPDTVAARINLIGPVTNQHIVVISPTLVGRTDLQQFGHVLRSHLGVTPMIIVAEPDQIHLLDEDAMRRCGWVRA